MKNFFISSERLVESAGMKFPGNTCFMVLLKFINKHDFTLFLEKTVLEKPQEGGGQIESPVLLGLKIRR